MEIRGQLQCKALRGREKSRRRRNNGYQWKSNAKNNGSNEKYNGVTTCGRDAGVMLTPIGKIGRAGDVHALVKKILKNTGDLQGAYVRKIQEGPLKYQSKEKARALNRRITGAKNGKIRAINRWSAPVRAGGFPASDFCHHGNRPTRATTKARALQRPRPLEKQTRPKR
jgi:hypothetical protein